MEQVTLCSWELLLPFASQFIPSCLDFPLFSLHFPGPRLSLVAKWRSYVAQTTFQNIKKNGLRHTMLFQNTFPVLRSATKRILYTGPGKHFKPGQLTPSEG